MLVLRKVKQLLSNFEAERWENLSNLRLAKKSVAYKKNSSVCINACFKLASLYCGLRFVLVLSCFILETHMYLGLGY